MADQDDTNVNDDDGTDEQDTSRQVTLSRSQIRSLERDAKGFKEAQAKAAAAERQLAFVEAGIKPSDPKMSYFVKGYDGELTAEAITKAATDAGFLAPPAQDPQDATAQELAAHDRVSSASAGTSSRQDEPIKKLYEAAAGGKEALLAEIGRHRNVVTG